MQTISGAWHTEPLPASEVLEIMVFTLGEQEYGVDLRKVRELRCYDPVTPIPDAPAFIRGAFDLLGTAVPLVDMRVAIGVSAPASAPFSDIVVLNVGGRPAGAAVDSVVDVITLGAAQIAPPPSTGLGLYTNCLFGVGTLDGRRLMLVDIDHFMLDAMAILGKHAV